MVLSGGLPGMSWELSDWLLGRTDDVNDLMPHFSHNGTLVSREKQARRWHVDGSEYESELESFEHQMGNKRKRRKKQASKQAHHNSRPPVQVAETPNKPKRKMRKHKKRETAPVEVPTAVAKKCRALLRAVPEHCQNREKAVVKLAPKYPLHEQRFLDIIKLQAEGRKQEQASSDTSNYIGPVRLIQPVLNRPFSPKRPPKLIVSVDNRPRIHGQCFSTLKDWEEMDRLTETLKTRIAVSCNSQPKECVSRTKGQNKRKILRDTKMNDRERWTRERQRSTSPTAPELPEMHHDTPSNADHDAMPGIDIRETEVQGSDFRRLGAKDLVISSSSTKRLDDRSPPTEDNTVRGRLFQQHEEPAPPSNHQSGRTTPPISQSSSAFNPAGITTAIPDHPPPPPSTPTKLTRRKTGKASPYFTTTSSPCPNSRRKAFLTSPISHAIFPPLTSPSFGLIQELLCDQPFNLLLACLFLNRTSYRAAIPAFYALIASFPTPKDLANAMATDILEHIDHLGLQNNRAKTIQAIARTWCANPPEKGKRYRMRDYPCKGDGCDIKTDEVLVDEIVDPRNGAWEVAHLLGVGAYALDSWRIFCRDKLRGVAGRWNIGDAKGSGGLEPEWKRVLPRDKELRAYLKWMWMKEGWDWDPVTGERKSVTEEVLERVKKGGFSIATEHDGSDAGAGDEAKVCGGG